MHIQFIKELIKYFNTFSLNVILGGTSAALFFLEPSPFESNKPVFVVLIALIIWLIYTVDHLFDGYKAKGDSGVFRYDFHYKYRYYLITICLFILTAILDLVFKNREENFIINGLYLSPVLIIYFVLKLKNRLNPMLKMGVVSAVIAVVMVLLYHEENLLYGMFRFEFLIMILMVFLNQLVLESFEVSLGDFTNTTFNQPETYRNLGDRVFIWICVLLGISAILNPFALPNILSLLIVSIGLKCILIFRKKFQKDGLYRFGADFVFVLLWPVYKLLMLAWNVCLGKF